MVHSTSRPIGLALIQVDGLSKRHLNEAFERGLMPNLQERIENGTLQLDQFRCGLPSQTTVSIAGMLYGEMLPGNQWYDKERQEVVDTFSLDDSYRVATELAEKHEGLAKGGGSVYLSPVDGEAHPKDSLFVFSDVGRVHQTEGRWGMIKNSLGEFGVLAKQLALHPIKAVQSAVHFGSEIVNDLKNKKTTGRSLKTIVQDAFKETIIPDAASLRIAEQIKKGATPFAYLDLANFDAKSHTYGPGEKAFATLPGIDKNLDVILDAVESAPEPYDVAIVADHGSARSYHFNELYGESLQELVTNLSGRDDILSMDFGSGAHIYLKSEPGELQRDNLPKGLVEGLRDHPGVAFTVTRKGDDTLIESSDGTVRVSEDEVVVEGEDPIKAFENDTPKAAREIHNMAHREHTGDVIVFGKLHKDGVIDFSTGRFKGLHGGIGLQQTEPFIVWNPEMGLQPESVKDAADLHHQLRRKMNQRITRP